MAKAPRIGEVKTRLAASIGGPRAVNFYRHLSSRLIHQLSRDPRWQTHLALSPDSALGMSFWPNIITSAKSPNLTLCPQGRGTLGTRMQRLFKDYSPAPTLIIGTDIPGITTSHIANAFKKLGSHQVVFGPSGDGGYWCVGQRNRPRIVNLFENVRWSGPHALDDSISGLSQHIALTAQLGDVDTVSDYNAQPTNLKNRWLISHT